MAEVVGYVLSGLEGGREQTNIAYYHRADRLRELAEERGYPSLVQYAKRDTSEMSAIRRISGSAWMADLFKDALAVYAAGAEAGGMAAWALRKGAVPVLYDVHTPAVGEKWMAFKMAPSAREFAVYLEACIAEYLCVRRTDHLLWCSLIQESYYARRGFPIERMHEVRHGVDLERFDAGPVPKHEKPLLVYAGTMRAYQGADRLVEGYELARESGLRLRMVGFTPEESAMREHAERLGIETHGMVPHVEMAGLLRDATATVIVAHPDAVRYKNGAAPTKWPECLALGRPILSGDAYDTAKLIRDLGVGWVVENSATGLAQGMRQLAATPHQVLQEMGTRGRAEAEKNYGWRTIGDKFAGVISASSKR
jgi:glycosyltransferase involved in cell wall biosynthesis